MEINVSFAPKYEKSEHPDPPHGLKLNRNTGGVFHEVILTLSITLSPR